MNVYFKIFKFDKNNLKNIFFVNWIKENKYHNYLIFI